MKLAKPLSLLLTFLALACATLQVDTADAIITEFSSSLTPSAKPMGLVAGPDGNVWFTHYGEDGLGAAIGRISPAGVITEFRDGLEGGYPDSLVVGPDGNLWFGITGSKTGPAIAKITPEGEITRVATLTSKTSPDELTVGPGGRVWWVSNGGARPGLGYVQPGGLNLQIHTATWPSDIVAGPDGNMWFTYGEGSVAAIARIDSPEDPGDTTITYFRDGLREKSDPGEIILGPDGNLWFTDSRADAIGKVTMDGTITEFDAPAFDPSLAAGPDGNVWYADSGFSRITPAGDVTWFGTPHNGESRVPRDLTVGPDGNLWFVSSLYDPGNGARWAGSRRPARSRNTTPGSARDRDHQRSPSAPTATSGLPIGGKRVQLAASPLRAIATCHAGRSSQLQHHQVRLHPQHPPTTRSPG